MIKAKLQTNTFRLLIIVFLILLTIITSLGWTGHLITSLRLNQVQQANDRYLESAMHQSLTTFGVLSVIKVGLAIVEGTEIGVGFNLQVGDAVQVAYDYVDVAWRTVLASATVILGTRYILQTAELADQWVLSLTLILLLIFLLYRWYRPHAKTSVRILRDVTLFFTIFTVSLYVLLPLSVTGGRLLSARITAPSLQEAEEGLAIVQTELFPEGSPESPSIWNTIKNATDQITRMSRILTRKASDLISWVLKLIAGYLFDSLVFPLLLFLFLFWITRLTGRYLFGIQTRRTFQEDLQQMIKRLESDGHRSNPHQLLSGPGD